MLEIHVSEHKLGVLIEGDYHDLYMLYKALDSVIASGMLENAKASENYLYSMMYDIRKAMHGEREFDLFQNQLDETIIASLQVKDDINIYYGFYTLHSDMMFILATLHLVDESIGMVNYHYLRMFMGLVSEAYEIEDFFKKPATYSLANYYHQYIELCTLRLLECEEDMRMGMAHEFIEDITSFNEDYTSLVEEVNTYAKENNCSPYEVTYIDDLEDIEY